MPFSPSLPYALCLSSGGGTQTVDNLAVPFDFFWTNSDDLTLSSGDDGVDVAVSGVFLLFASFDASDDDCTVYTQFEPLSNYPIFGDEAGTVRFATSAILSTTKSRQNHIAISRAFSATAAAPWKAILASAKRTLGGPDVSYTQAGLAVVKLSDLTS